MDDQDAQNMVDAIGLIIRYGAIDGAHHKDWVLQQVLKTLLDWDDQKLNEYLTEQEWEKGIPP